MEKNNLIQSLNWRYATKIFDTSKKLSEEQINLVVEALRLSPSSFGLQGWKFIRVIDPAKRQLLREAAYGQAQITDASDLFVLTVPLNYSMENIDEYINSTAKARNLKPEDLASFREMMSGYMSSKNSAQILEWLKRQVYIALGTALTVCAASEIDACPMEGFDSNRFDEILDLKSKNLTSVVLMPVGYRSVEDKYATMPKSRFETSEVLIEIEI